MPKDERQQLITEIAEKVLGISAEPQKSFDWFRNIHTQEDFGIYFPLINHIFLMLGGDLEAGKEPRLLKCDAYLPAPLNCIFEFDEHQHFSTARLKTLELYPSKLRLGFAIDEYKRYCGEHRLEADKYRYTKRTRDFDFEGGRTAQRAYLDCFRDILPSLHGLNPTIRIAAFEVVEVTGNDARGRAIVKKLLRKKLHQE